jgi:glucose/mannose-6-phosphate isomerase
MNLDDTAAFKKLDREDMLGHINGLPGQLTAAWDLAHRLSLPDIRAPQKIVIAGMGGSAIGADLLASYILPLSPVPVTVHRDYDLPAWASGPEVLFIASSHSGNTEETLSAFEAARSRGCTLFSISTGGKLEQMALESGTPLWKFTHNGQPRAAVGFSFGLLLGLFARLNLIPDPEEDLKAALAAMEKQQAGLLPEVPASRNLAKRMAGQFMGRWVSIMASGIMAPVARRWKGQVSEIAKAWAQFEFLPEADHNTLAGLLNPSELLERGMFIFLRSPSDHPRNCLRSDITRRVFMQEGLNTDFVDARGETPLAQMWTMLHLGDYIAYYLAMAYGVDPTPVEAIQSLKAEMK